MEPVTHILTGAVLARSGFNRKAAYATAAMAIAAEFPDIDTLWSAAGPLQAFEHHRGITHTFIAVPFEAALITAAFFLFHRLRKPSTKAPPNWAWLYAGTLVALLSHLLLDWTNNYGIRPFFPFNPRWYAGSFVFIFEPVLFLILLAALVGPLLFALINAEVGTRRQAFRGQPSCAPRTHRRRVALRPALHRAQRRRTRRRGQHTRCRARQRKPCAHRSLHMAHGRRHDVALPTRQRCTAAPASSIHRSLRTYFTSRRCRCPCW